MESAMDLSSTELVSLEDEQLDDVAGGCRHGRRGGWWGRRRGHGGGRGFGVTNVDVDVDIDINVINFVGNNITAGGDVNILLAQEN